MNCTDKRDCHAFKSRNEPVNLKLFTLSILFPLHLALLLLLQITLISHSLSAEAAFVPHWPHHNHNHNSLTSNQLASKFASISKLFYSQNLLGSHERAAPAPTTSSRVTHQISLNKSSSAPSPPKALVLARSKPLNKTSIRQVRSLAYQQQQQSLEGANGNAVGPSFASPSSCQAGKRPAVFGLRCDNGEMLDGELLIKANEESQIILIGQNLELNFSLALTPTQGLPGEDCTHMDRVKSIPVLTYLTTTSAQVEFNLPWPGSKMPYYMCIRELKDLDATVSTNSSSASNFANEPWYHQGSHNLVRLYVHQEWLPLYMKIINIFILLMLSGLFSGLNLGLMALDKNELAVIISCGSEKEKRYARAIEPVRRRGNYLLCSILFSNVLINSTIAVLLEDFTSGSVAVMTSTIFIVMFGEILPQAFCSRHGLAVGAKTVFITYLCMFLTCPLSYPVSFCLDWALGEEINHAYDRERLMEFIRITSDYNNLETEEVNIISGALKLKRVHVDEVMTRIEDAFMLDINASLDFDTIKAIVESGYSRVPVHEPNNKRAIIALLLTKDLALIDPDDKTPVQTLISFYQHPVMFMFEDSTLHSALNEFKTGKSHMSFVRRVLDDGDRDPVYEVTGIVTFEDVVEEILQMEINDETDTLSDNRRKRRRKEAQVRSDFLQFTSRQYKSSGDWSHDICVTPQLCLAAYQFLATNVEPFTKKYLSDLVLKRLLAQKIYYKIRVEPSASTLDLEQTARLQASSASQSANQEQMQRQEQQRVLYKAGHPADYFIMILDGRVSVVCGSEQLAYEAGPFSYYGKSALINVAAGDQQLAVTATTTAKKLGSKASRKISPSAGNLQLQLPESHQQQQKEDQLTSSMSSEHVDQQPHYLSSGLSRNQAGGSSQSISIAATIIQQQLEHEQQLHTKLDPGAVNSWQNAAAALGFDKFKLANQRNHSIANMGTLPAPTTFVPDYTVRVITNVSYLKITRDQYYKALNATLSMSSANAAARASEQLAGQVASQQEQNSIMLGSQVIELDVLSSETNKLLNSQPE